MFQIKYVSMRKAHLSARQLSYRLVKAQFIQGQSIVVVLLTTLGYQGLGHLRSVSCLIIQTHATKKQVKKFFSE